MPLKSRTIYTNVSYLHALNITDKLYTRILPARIKNHAQVLCRCRLPRENCLWQLDLNRFLKHLHACKHVCVCICIYAHMYVSVSVCVIVCVSVCV